MKIRLFSALVLTSLTACSLMPEQAAIRAPGSQGPSILVPTDLKEATGQFRRYIQSSRFQAANCAAVLNGVYERVYKIHGSHFHRASALRNFDAIMENLWLSKIALRHRMKEFLEAGKLRQDCVDAARNVLRAGRYVEDYISYLKVNPSPADEKNLLQAFQGGYPYLLLNPAVKKLEFRSGDVLLSRGSAFTSSAIARIGDVDGQFSHMAIVYVDENTGKVYTVEAHIEIGVKTFSIEEYLSDGKGRAVLFRYHDQELAHLAAKRMFELAERVSASGENIPYNFSMVTGTSDSLFCSEVVQYGYELAGKELGRKLELPLFSTSISMRNRSFLDALGVKARETFAPSDIEVDPRLELIAEWRDLSRVRKLHQYDAVLVKVYQWMEDHDYVLKGDLFTWSKWNLIWSARRWPLFSGLLKEKFPKNMSSRMLGTVAKLNSVAGAMYEEIRKADSAHAKKTGLPMTPKEMEAFLDDLRIQDLKDYREYQDCQRFRSGPDDHCMAPLPKFHWDFRPRKEP